MRTFAGPTLGASLLASLLTGCGDGRPGGATAESSGPEATYRRYCYSCHAVGAAGAPRVGDEDAWRPRIAQGWNTLLTHTIGGVRTMPPKGLCRQCSDEELAAVLGWMLDLSGGRPADAPAPEIPAAEPLVAGEAR